MKKIITGVAGFIGFHIAKYCLEQGDTILGIDNLNDYYDPTLKEARLSQLNNYNNFSFHKLISLIKRKSILFSKKNHLNMLFT